MMVFTQHLLMERNVWDGAMQMAERRDVILTSLDGINFNSLLKLICRFNHMNYVVLDVGVQGLKQAHQMKNE